MTDDVGAIVKGLTKAQRTYLTEKAEWRSPTGYCEPRWMTFPPSNTFRVLKAKGLVDGVGQIREKGLAVRTYLEENPDA